MCLEFPSPPEVSCDWPPRARPPKVPRHACALSFRILFSRSSPLRPLARASSMVLRTAKGAECECYRAIHVHGAQRRSGRRTPVCVQCDARRSLSNANSSNSETEIGSVGGTSYMERADTRPVVGFSLEMRLWMFILARPARRRRGEGTRGGGAGGGGQASGRRGRVPFAFAPPAPRASLLPLRAASLLKVVVVLTVGYSALHSHR